MTNAAVAAFKPRIITPGIGNHATDREKPGTHNYVPATSCRGQRHLSGRAMNKIG